MSQRIIWTWRVSGGWKIICRIIRARLSWFPMTDILLMKRSEIVYELTDKKLVRYVGNYTQFRQQKLKNLGHLEEAVRAAAGRIGTAESADRAFQAQTEKGSLLLDPRKN